MIQPDAVRRGDTFNIILDLSPSRLGTFGFQVPSLVTGGQKPRRVSFVILEINTLGVN